MLLAEHAAETGESAQSPDLPPKESEATTKEINQLRQEKLATIRQALARGDYDSDELLEKAMNQMVKRLEDDRPSESQK